MLTRPALAASPTLGQPDACHAHSPCLRALSCTEQRSLLDPSPAVDGTSNASGTHQWLLTRNITRDLAASAAQRHVPFYADTDLRLNLGTATIHDNFQRGAVDSLARTLRDAVATHANISLVDVGPFTIPTERILVRIELVLAADSRGLGSSTLLGAVADHLEDNVREISPSQIDDLLHGLDLGDDAYSVVASRIDDPGNTVAEWRLANPRTPPPPPSTIVDQLINSPSALVLAATLTAIAAAVFAILVRRWWRTQQKRMRERALVKAQSAAADDDQSAIDVSSTSATPTSPPKSPLVGVFDATGGPREELIAREIIRIDLRSRTLTDATLRMLEPKSAPTICTSARSGVPSAHPSPSRRTSPGGACGATTACTSSPCTTRRPSVTHAREVATYAPRKPPELADLAEIVEPTAEGGGAPFSDSPRSARSLLPPPLAQLLPASSTSSPARKPRAPPVVPTEAAIRALDRANAEARERARARAMTPKLQKAAMRARAARVEAEAEAREADTRPGAEVEANQARARAPTARTTVAVDASDVRVVNTMASAPSISRQEELKAALSTMLQVSRGTVPPARRGVKSHPPSHLRPPRRSGTSPKPPRPRAGARPSPSKLLRLPVEPRSQATVAAAPTRPGQEQQPPDAATCSDASISVRIAAALAQAQALAQKRQQLVGRLEATREAAEAATVEAIRCEEVVAPTLEPPAACAPAGVPAAAATPAVCEGAQGRRRKRDVVVV